MPTRPFQRLGGRVRTLDIGVVNDAAPRIAHRVPASLHLARTDDQEQNDGDDDQMSRRQEALEHDPESRARLAVPAAQPLHPVNRCEGRGVEVGFEINPSMPTTRGTSTARPGRGHQHTERATGHQQLD